MCDGVIEQDMSPGSNSTKRVGRILTLLIIIIILIYITKNQKVCLCGRGDLTSLFFSKVAK